MLKQLQRSFSLRLVFNLIFESFTPFAETTFWLVDESAPSEKLSKSLAEKSRFDNRAQSNLDTGYFPAKLDGKEGYDILHKGIYWQSGTNDFGINYNS